MCLQSEWSPILVTGATGFVGRNLCSYLAERGYRVRALVRRTSDPTFLNSWGVEKVWGDLCDPASVVVAAEHCRAVVHAGALFRFWGKRETFWAVNVEGTENVLKAAWQAGARRFVHISTIAVVGKPPARGLITEETPCRPQDAYQASKWEAERRALSFGQQSGLPVIVLRPGAIYGPWSRYAFNRLFIEDPLRGLAFRVHGGRHITFPVFVRDVAWAVEAVLARGRPGEIYNICGPCVSHREVGEVLERLIGRPIRWIPAPAWGMVALAWLWTVLSHWTRREPYYPIGLYPYVFYDWRVSAEKAQRELGYQPTSLEEGLRETLEWYHSNRLFPGNFASAAKRRMLRRRRSMAVIERSFFVAAPPERVFAFLADHANDPQWLPGLVESRNFTGEGTNYQWEWTYRMAGISFDGTGHVVEHDPPRRHVVQTRGGAVSTWAWTLKPEGAGTRVHLRLEYTIPVAVVGKLAEKLLLAQNEKAADEGMANLQRILGG
ncbi:MAG: NAD-dependent epimerase/dehydratase family protein [Anaerolineae bacterium]|nr:NAD-dependent epimerase/dehydratase family protein [Anaerolineae bacterium]MDW8069366.1 NAD-dependent epimerase/dehydratase family protein [Anaerolineae bacterium]